MPKKITTTPVWVEFIEVPRDGEGIDAADVELPMSDLLGNDRYLLQLVNNLSTQIEDLKRSRGGFTISVQPGLQLEPSTNKQVTVLIGRYDGFTDPVDLVVDGLPGGVTATLSESSVTGDSSVLTLTASNAAVAGVYTILVSGASGTRTALGRLQLTVTAQTLPASFDLVGLPAQVSVDRADGNNAGTVFARIERTGGFSDAVSMSAPNLPAGVTVNFDPAGPNSTSGTVAAITVAESVPAGTYNLQLRGSAGNKVVTKAISLIVTALPQVSGDFQLSIAYDNGSQLVANGATITINRTGGFAGDVSLRPTQATISIPGSSTITLTEVPAPVMNINGQTGTVVTNANTVRVTANGAATGWTNSGVARPVTIFDYVLSRDLITLDVEATATINGQLITRRIPVSVRLGTRSY